MDLINVKLFSDIKDNFESSHVNYLKLSIYMQASTSAPVYTSETCENIFGLVKILVGLFPMFYIIVYYQLATKSPT
jgi:hypothetical protein